MHLLLYVGLSFIPLAASAPAIGTTGLAIEAPVLTPGSSTLYKFQLNILIALAL